jgi:hypothetical protein
VARGEFGEIPGQEVVQKHIRNHAGVLAVAGRAQALGAAAHHGVLVGEGVDGAVQADAGLHGGWVVFELLARHRIGDELAQQNVDVSPRIG